MAAINEDFNHGMDYFWQYDKDLERYIAVNVVGWKYDFRGLSGHNNIKV